MSDPTGSRDGSTLAVLGPVARQTVQDQVYGELRRSLIQGAFDAGEILRIRDLAARMSISTMPVREALARLISERALEALPNRSVRVPLIRRERLEDLARARALIEGELTAMALPRLTQADREALWDATRAYDNLSAGRIDTAREAADLNHAFHFAIYRAAGSAVPMGSNANQAGWSPSSSTGAMPGAHDAGSNGRPDSGCQPPLRAIENR